jgi:hypothetical protein
MRHPFPLKSKRGLMLIPSDNPHWEYEVYDYRGLFISYLGPRE